MSTANLVPETWGLTGDDAKETLAHAGRTAPDQDAFKRLRVSDGFSHARSHGLPRRSSVRRGGDRAGRHRERARQRRRSARDRARPASDRPGPGGTRPDRGGRTRRTGPARPATGSRSRSARSARSITGTTLMGQVERALNRLYGIETGPAHAAASTARAACCALTAGALAVLAFVGLGARRRDRDVARRQHRAHDLEHRRAGRSASRLLIAAMALIFRWAPRRHQPAWSWLVVRRDRGRRAAGARHARARTCSSSSARRSARPTVRSPASSRSRSGRSATLDRAADRRRARRPAGGRARRRAPRPQHAEGRESEPRRATADDRAVGRTAARDHGRGDRRSVRSVAERIATAAPRARGHHRRARDRGQRDRGPAQRRRDLPGDARGDRAARAHDRPPDVRLLAGRDRHDGSRGARRARAGGCARAGAPRRVGRAPDRHGAARP